MLRNMASRRLWAKPVEARAPYLPPMKPAYRPTPASSTMAMPLYRIACIFPAVMPSSTIRAINRGIVISTTTSSSMKVGVRTEAFLYCLT